ncbi:MAG: efflux RND transporter permease subunit [Caulobacteraceae bacterium]
MNFSAPFVRRPVATSLLAAACFIIGVVCCFRLPVSALPQVDYPTLLVTASLPGASPETMASNVASPLERQMSLIPGVTEMTSTSAFGSTSITLQFKLDRNIDGAAQDVQAAINASAGQLPNNLPSPPTVRKVNPADAPIVVLSLSSRVLPIERVSDYADNVVAQQISRMDGVGLVTVGGAQKPAVRIRVDPQRAASLGLQLDTVRAALAANTVNAPKGNLIGRHAALTVYANDQVLNAAPWNDLIIGYKSGAAIRVRDVGGAIDGAEDDQSGAYSQPGAANRDPTLTAGQTININVTKSPGANVIHTVEAIRAALPRFRAALPPGIDLHVIKDKTGTIRASVADVEFTLAITIVLLVVVIFLFLRDLRATLIPSAIIPLSLLATAAVMLAAGFSLDNLSLMALTIAVGFVVDDVIVMVEAIWRRIEHGEPPFQAALNGAAEIGFTVLSISLSLVAVFTPLMFMGGVVGRLMREFALTVSAAVLVSVVLSLTFTPMLCARFLKPPALRANPLIEGLERGFAALERAYARGLGDVMEHKAWTFALFLATLALSGWLFATSATGFFPQQDTGFLQGALQTQQSASYAETDAKAREAVRIIAADPDVVETHYSIAGNVTSAELNVTLRPRESGRTASPDEIIGRLRPRLARLVGSTTVLRSNQDISIGARGTRAQYQYTLSDNDLDELNLWAPRMTAAMARLPQIRDVNSDQQSSAPSMTLTINREAAARFDIAPADIDAAIYNQIGSHEIAQYFTQLNAYHVIMEAPPASQATADLFDKIYINSPSTSQPVALSTFTRMDDSRVRPLSISHQGELPAVTISFNLAPGVSLGDATEAIARERASLGAPESLSGAFQGTAQAFQQSLSTMPVLIVAALLSVYVILGVLYESYTHPLTILSTLPSAGVGALFALRIAGMDLNVIGIIAIILLIGIVKKNGIMIVDVALKLEREEGMSCEAAAVEASKRRLRPILMTTVCSLLGGLPMILQHGTGSEFRQPLGWAIVGGLAVSQVLTLFSTPVVYIFIDRAANWVSRRRSQSPRLVEG